MTPSAATSAITKAALVVLAVCFWLYLHSSKFRYPVPVTGQTLVVLLIGMTYGPRLGGITMTAYLFEGALGLPVFAGGAAGAAILMGPTGGYLFGFAGGRVHGIPAQRGMGRTVVSTIAAMVVGNLVIVVWRAVAGKLCGFGQAIAAGVLPFLYGDALKLVVAAGLMPLAWRVVTSIR